MAIHAQCALSIGHLPAGADLSTHQYKLVTVDSSGDVQVASAVSDPVIGVLANKPLAGQPCTIEVIGVTEVIAGATIVPGDELYLTATGTVDKTATSVRVGTALSGGSSGQLITALVNCSAAAAD